MKNTLICFILFTIFYQNVFAQCTPNAGTDDSTCGLSYNLNGTSSGLSGSSFLWTSDYPGTTITNATQLYPYVTIPSFTGLFKIVHFILAETNGACTNSDTVTIDFRTIPIISAGLDTTVCGQTCILSADTILQGYWTSSTFGVIYTPNFSDPNANVWIPSYSQPTKTVTFTWHANNGPCLAQDDVIITFSQCTSIAENNVLRNFIIFPNPVINSNCSINYTSKTFDKISIRIFDTQGIEVLQKLVLKNSESIQIQIDTSELTNGYYLTELIDGQKIIRKPIIIQNRYGNCH